MRGILREYLKYCLTVIGARVKPHTHHQFLMVVNYMKIGLWMRNHGFNFDLRVRDRNEVFSVVANQITDKKVLYLEFGVFKGESMQFWSRELKHPSASLHGFDSFEGLPEDFDVDGPYTKGTFDVDGAIPQIEDQRVRFFKGWFDQTLINYTVPPHEVLVIVMDADLYSSTIYVLRHFKSIIREGTFIFFDEMSRPEHEPKAFDEFMKETGLKFIPICSDLGFNRVFFKCIGC